MRFLFPLLIFILACSCMHHDKQAIELIKVDNAWLDSIKKKADTCWTKPYRNKDFKTAEYYIDKKDSIVTQVMKDTTGTIRQINIARYDNIRLFFAEYYVNGQLMAHFPLDSNGKYHGQTKLYYETGRVKSMGNYEHAFHNGLWKNYDENGKLTSTDLYDKNGQLVNSIKK